MSGLSPSRYSTLLDWDGSISQSTSGSILNAISLQPPRQQHHDKEKQEAIDYQVNVYNGKNLRDHQIETTAEAEAMTLTKKITDSTLVVEVASDPPSLPPGPLFTPEASLELEPEPTKQNLTDFRDPEFNQDIWKTPDGLEPEAYAGIGTGTSIFLSHVLVPSLPSDTAPAHYLKPHPWALGQMEKMRESTPSILFTCPPSPGTSLLSRTTLPRRSSKKDKTLSKLKEKPQRQVAVTYSNIEDALNASTAHNAADDYSEFAADLLAESVSVSRGKRRRSHADDDEDEDLYVYAHSPRGRKKNKVALPTSVSFLKKGKVPEPNLKVLKPKPNLSKELFLPAPSSPALVPGDVFPRTNEDCNEDRVRLYVGRQRDLAPGNSPSTNSVSRILNTRFIRKVWKQEKQHSQASAMEKRLGLPSFLGLSSSLASKGWAMCLLRAGGSATEIGKDFGEYWVDGSDRSSNPDDEEETGDEHELFRGEGEEENEPKVDDSIGSDVGLAVEEIFDHASAQQQPKPLPSSVSQPTLPKLSRPRPRTADEAGSSILSAKFKPNPKPFTMVSSASSSYIPLSATQSARPYISYSSQSLTSSSSQSGSNSKESPTLKLESKDSANQTHSLQQLLQIFSDKQLSSHSLPSALDPLVSGPSQVYEPLNVTGPSMPSQKALGKRKAQEPFLSAFSSMIATTSRAPHAPDLYSSPAAYFSPFAYQGHDHVTNWDQTHSAPQVASPDFSRSASYSPSSAYPFLSLSPSQVTMPMLPLPRVQLQHQPQPQPYSVRANHDLFLDIPQKAKQPVDEREIDQVPSSKVITIHQAADTITQERDEAAGIVGVSEETLCLDPGESAQGPQSKSALETIDPSVLLSASDTNTSTEARQVYYTGDPLPPRAVERVISVLPRYQKRFNSTSRSSSNTSIQEPMTESANLDVDVDYANGSVTPDVGRPQSKPESSEIQSSFAIDSANNDSEIFPGAIFGVEKLGSDMAEKLSSFEGRPLLVSSPTVPGTLESTHSQSLSPVEPGPSSGEQLPVFISKKVDKDQAYDNNNDDALYMSRTRRKKSNRKAKQSNNGKQDWPKGPKGYFCHHCRGTTYRLHMHCSSCKINYCVRCIILRYPDVIEFDASRTDFVCFRCSNNSCRCDRCHYRRGEKYTPLTNRKSVHQSSGPEKSDNSRPQRSRTVASSVMEDNDNTEEERTVVKSKVSRLIPARREEEWPQGTESYYCHQCRRATWRQYMGCASPTCSSKYCVRCITCRYSERIEFDASRTDFICFRCENTCCCDLCCARRGEVYISMRPIREAVSTIPAKPLPPISIDVEVSEPVIYWNAVYNREGEAIAAAYVTSVEKDDVIFARPFPPRRRTFIGDVQPEWRLGDHPKWRLLGESGISEAELGGTETASRKMLRYFVGESPPANGNVSDSVYSRINVDDKSADDCASCHSSNEGQELNHSEAATTVRLESRVKTETEGNATLMEVDGILDAPQTKAHIVASAIATSGSPGTQNLESAGVLDVEMLDAPHPEDVASPQDLPLATATAELPSMAANFSKLTSELLTAETAFESEAMSIEDEAKTISPDSQFNNANVHSLSLVDYGSPLTDIEVSEEDD